MGIRSLRQAPTWIALGTVVVLGSASACMRATPPPTSAAPKLDCGLAAEGPLVAGGPINVRFTLTNRGETPLHVLRWYTPLEGVRSDLFVVTPVQPSGQPLPYQGPLVKRADPGRDDYAELAPGGSVSGSADIAPAYGLDAAGLYTVEFVRGLSDLVTDPAELPRKSESHQPLAITCPPIQIDVAPAGS